ncbi:MAG: hypothetical protein ACLGJD_28400 [Gammaproteobacteria bacterium]|uniref:hypothetical protein n=1 Tax=Pseudacidovorax sp. TaxID=1934311 RepID=UPI001B5702EB|nr:hypothetical protein [Pseudacidovorax sp.]MBP6897731.1 hypothetical protein [Pseudacidovorax sp.]
MSPLQFLDHLLNFVAPAIVVAGLLALGLRVTQRTRSLRVPLWKQVAITTGAGVVTLLGGLVLTGHDGRMATYAALALVAGTVQWALLRGGR